MEAWWKHEGRNRCAILTICAQAALADPAHNWRKPRNNSRFHAIVHGLFDTTHNLKVTGSNPVPATSLSEQAADKSQAAFLVATEDRERKNHIGV